MPTTLSTNVCPSDVAIAFFAGRKIFQYLKTRKIKGETGQVAFDDNGDRIYAEYDVINIREKQHKKAVGKYFYDNVSLIISFAFAILYNVPYVILLFLFSSAG